MQLPPSTTAYAEYFSSQEWAADPDLMAIEVTKALVERAEAGLALLRGSGFDSLTDAHASFKWGLLVEDDDESSGYALFEAEYTLKHPVLLISDWASSTSSSVRFVCDFKHTADRAWCELSGPDLARYADKAWVESYGYVFVQLPDAPDGTPGKWLCVDPIGPERFQVQCDDLMECIEETATWLEAGIDEDALPRPDLTQLRKSPPSLLKGA